VSDDPFLRTVPESASLLRLSKATMWRLIADGRLETVKVGAATRIRESELLRFVGALEPTR
jgi:excisionase family DNA binding protein